MFYIFHADDDAGPSGVVACTWHCITGLETAGTLLRQRTIRSAFALFCFDVYSNKTDRLLVTCAAAFAAFLVR